MKFITPFNKDDLFQPKEPVVGPHAGGKTLAAVLFMQELKDKYPNASFYSNFKIDTKGDTKDG